MNENIESRRKNLKELTFDKSPTNASLWLNKYIREQKGDGQESTAKQDLVNRVSQIEVPDIYKYFYQDMWLKSLETSGDKYFEKRFIEISGRMIIGLGAESVLETSITLHRTYGVPYIPGSALKGLAASYAHRSMGEGWNKEKKNKDKNKKIGEAHKLMFGSQDSAGYVIFHDALYVPNSYGKTPLRPDILTVHHQKYYEGKGNAPADWDSPVPIPLLSAQGQYLLAVSANSGNVEFDKKIAELAVEVLKLALRDEGIGAKTSSGYGRADVKPFEENRNQVISVAETKLLSLPRNLTPQLTEEERQAKSEQKNQNIFANIEKKLLEVSDFERDTRKKLKAIVRDDLSRLEGDLKIKGANLVRDKVRDKSKKSDADLTLQQSWFKEINLMLGE